MPVDTPDSTTPPHPAQHQCPEALTINPQGAPTCEGLGRWPRRASTPPANPFPTPSKGEEMTFPPPSFKSFTEILRSSFITPCCQRPFPIPIVHAVMHALSHNHNVRCSVFACIYESSR